MPTPREVTVHFRRKHGRIASGPAEEWTQIGLESPQSHGGGFDQMLPYEYDLKFGEKIKLSF